MGAMGRASVLLAFQDNQRHRESTIDPYSRKPSIGPATPDGFPDSTRNPQDGRFSFDPKLRFDIVPVRPLGHPGPGRLQDRFLEGEALGKAAGGPRILTHFDAFESNFMHCDAF